jgi:hypothetical protein
MLWLTGYGFKFCADNSNWSGLLSVLYIGLYRVGLNKSFCIWFILFLCGPSAYDSGSTSALWLIVLSPYWTSQLSLLRASTPPKQRKLEL